MKHTEGFTKTFRTKSNDYVKKYGDHVDNVSGCVVANPAEYDESLSVPKIPRGSLSDKSCVIYATQSGK